jgi:hypothetical protein
MKNENFSYSKLSRNEIWNSGCHRINRDWRIVNLIGKFEFTVETPFPKRNFYLFEG